MTCNPSARSWVLDSHQYIKKYIIQYNNSIGGNNNKVNELYSLFLKFSALGLLQDIKNNFHSLVASMMTIMVYVYCPLSVVTSHHFLPSCTQIGITLNYVTSFPAKIAYKAISSTLLKYLRAYEQLAHE